MLRVYEITNGWMGSAYVRVYVMAHTGQDALEIAKAKFKDDAVPMKKEAASNNLNIIESMMCIEGVVSSPSDEGLSRE